MSEVNLTDATFEKEVLKHEGLVLVDFFAPWCGPCKMMAPTIEKLAEEMKDKVKIGKVNVDENPTYSEKYEIRSIPTLVLFKNGEMVGQMIGFQSEEAIKQKVDSLA